jgi:hypothetical protein
LAGALQKIGGQGNSLANLFGGGGNSAAVSAYGNNAIDTMPSIPIDFG